MEKMGEAGGGADVAEVLCTKFSKRKRGKKEKALLLLLLNESLFV